MYTAEHTRSPSYQRWHQSYPLPIHISRDPVYVRDVAPLAVLLVSLLACGNPEESPSPSRANVRFLPSDVPNTSTFADPLQLRPLVFDGVML